jgi:hypothetical protein
MLELAIKTGNAAFCSDGGDPNDDRQCRDHELARILLRVVADLNSGELTVNGSMRLRDINGNSVGTVRLEE